MSRTMKYIFNVLVIVLSTSCSVKRPIIFSDPSFKDYKVLKNRCGFLLCDSINISSVVQDFISAFDGDPASGEAFIQAYLADCLTGRQKIYVNLPSRRRFWLAFSLLDSIHTDLTISQDAYGVAKLKVKNNESLSSALAAAQVEHLIIIYGLTVKRATAAYVEPMTGIQDFPVKGTTLVPGGSVSKLATMSAQVFVLRTESMSVVWNGFISGKWNIGFNFTRNTAKGVTEAFVIDLGLALR